MLYLVNCEVVKSYYLQDDDEREIMNHIVEADSEQDAEIKVTNYYSMKDCEYEVSYWVNFNYCNEVIR